MKTGDKAKVSPKLTGEAEWIEGEDKIIKQKKTKSPEEKLLELILGVRCF